MTQRDHLALLRAMAAARLANQVQARPGLTMNQRVHRAGQQLTQGQSLAGPLGEIYHGAGRLVHGRLPHPAQLAALMAIMPGKPGAILGAAQRAALQRELLVHPMYKDYAQGISSYRARFPHIADAPSLADRGFSGGVPPTRQSAAAAMRSLRGVPQRWHPQGEMSPEWILLAQRGAIPMGTRTLGGRVPPGYHWSPNQ